MSGLVVAGFVVVGLLLAGGCSSPAAGPLGQLPAPPGPAEPSSASTGSPTSSPVPSGAVPSGAVPSTSAPSAPSGPSARSTTPVPLPTASPWAAGPGEVRPAVKTVAARFVEVVGSWRSGAGAAEALVGRAASAGLLAPGVDGAGLASALAPLAAPAATEAEADVVYPQYGGLTEEAASVMVVTDQDLRGADGHVVRRGATLDVRLAPSPDGRWRVSGARPAGARPSPSGARPLVDAVLASGRIRLPEAAAADVRSGLVDDEALRVLLGVARGHVLDVSVVRTGHPAEVFGTDRTSNHTRGRAVDVWRVDGRPVVDPAARDVVVAVMRAGGAAGATEVGGPVDLDGPLREGRSGGFFSDDLHADHVHLGVTAGRDPIGS